MTARGTLFSIIDLQQIGSIKDMQSLLDPITKSHSFWIVQPPTWTQSQLSLLNSWKRYLSWERSNPLHYEDSSPLISRVVYAYQSALLDLRYFAEIWLDYATFLTDVERVDEAISVLERGIQDNPSRFFFICRVYLLHFV